MLSDDDRLVHIYTPLKQALVELKRRREDPELQKKVAEFFGPHMFEPMMGEPKLVYARHIVSPNYEFEKLWGQIKDIPMKILFFESSTEFVPKNKEKYFLGKLYFFKKKLNKTPINTKCIIDFTPNYGKLMHTINCYNGERFIEIHHKALENKYKEINNKCDYVDYMSWLLKVRDLKKYHYIYTFALFICNGIFFENYS